MSHMWHSLDELELAEHFLAMRHGEVPVVTVIRHRTHKYIFRVCVCVCVCVCVGRGWFGQAGSGLTGACAQQEVAYRVPHPTPANTM